MWFLYTVVKSEIVPTLGACSSCMGLRGSTNFGHLLILGLWRLWTLVHPWVCEIVATLDTCSSLGLRDSGNFGHLLILGSVR